LSNPARKAKAFRIIASDTTWRGGLTSKRVVVKDLTIDKRHLAAIRVALNYTPIERITDPSALASATYPENI
jgi:hypothetical protein